MAVEGPWDDWEGAARYATFVRDFGLYRRLNEELVDRAELETARRVLDLACGTGATARAALRRMAPGAALTGLDGSEVMVALARAEVPDSRARFTVAAAARLRDHVEGSFDRALCNAAFWQFPSPGVVIEALAGVMAPGGLLVFNLPVRRLGAETVSGGSGLSFALARSVERETGRPYEARASGVDASSLESELRRCGFDPPRRDRVTIPTTEGELLELMALPAMISRLAPELDPVARSRVFERLQTSIGPDRPAAVEWEYWVVGRT